ncbi:Thiosulfate sulfurtransferase RDL1, mitochondrial [Ceratocystis fimbriata CBS 114723]|uniref:Thiosulfate sulfurtransferase RDL1, mitochondrial n=1 Tax=Ceratocystis fimbriata CBS 114723 TaxID=1035309 RepID=A0A2C5X2G3_9PEZI|nr:Thiosulfate sulfurtransferase RDL1, mitochondrial [Ceratocystis fimbriata CBS 114723]
MSSHRIASIITPRAVIRASSTSVPRSFAPSALLTRCLASAQPSTHSFQTHRATAIEIASRRVFSSSTLTTQETVEVFDYEKMKKLVAEQPEEYIIVDARERGELVQTGTIPSAVNIPIASSPDSFQIHNEDFEDRFGFERPEKDKILLFFCKAGVRSHAAAKLARDAGWKTAEYPGSWVDWVAKGGDITHSFN